MDLKNSCGCISGYQARKGLQTGTVKTHFFQIRKLTIHKMTSAIKSYRSQSSLKNITLISYLLGVQQTVLLKLIHDFRRVEFSFMEKHEFLISKKLHSDMYFQLQ